MVTMRVGLLCLGMAVLSFGCATQRRPLARELSKRQQRQNQEQSFALADLFPQRAKVQRDPQHLAEVRWQVSMVGPERSEALLVFEAPSAVDFYAVKACPAGKPSPCWEAETWEPLLLIPSLPPGLVEVSVQACYAGLPPQCHASKQQYTQGPSKPQSERLALHEKMRSVYREAKQVLSLLAEFEAAGPSQKPLEAQEALLREMVSYFLKQPYRSQALAAQSLGRGVAFQMMTIAEEETRPGANLGLAGGSKLNPVVSLMRRHRLAICNVLLTVMCYMGPAQADVKTDKVAPYHGFVSWDDTARYEALVAREQVFQAHQVYESSKSLTKPDLPEEWAERSREAMAAYTDVNRTTFHGNVQVQEAAAAVRGGEPLLVRYEGARQSAKKGWLAWIAGLLNRGLGLAATQNPACNGKRAGLCQDPMALWVYGLGVPQDFDAATTQSITQLEAIWGLLQLAHKEAKATQLLTALTRQRDRLASLL